MHRASGLLGFFDFVLTREDYALSKPHPEPYVTACSRAQVSPSRCLAVEDSERGVTAATHAGLAVAAIPGPLTGGGNLSAARWRLRRLSEVPALLGL
jgi:beta-phosphoglucomutase-like phosphatase (HAD superfamily)